MDTDCNPDKNGKCYPCPDCHKTFATQVDLKAHLMRHITQHPYVCVACGKGFKYDHTLDFHIKSQHGVESLTSVSNNNNSNNNNNGNSITNQVSTGIKNNNINSNNIANNCGTSSSSPYNYIKSFNRKSNKIHRHDSSSLDLKATTNNTNLPPSLSHSLAEAVASIAASSKHSNLHHHHDQHHTSPIMINKSYLQGDNEDSMDDDENGCEDANNNHLRATESSSSITSTNNTAIASIGIPLALDGNKHNNNNNNVIDTSNSSAIHNKNCNDNSFVDFGIQGDLTPRSIQIKSEKVLITLLEGIHPANEQSYSLYKCCLCGFAFPNLEPISTHIQSMHSNHLNLTCDKCGATFKWKSELRLHDQLHIAIDQSATKCKQLIMPSFLQPNLVFMNPYFGDSIPSVISSNNNNNNINNNIHSINNNNHHHHHNNNNNSNNNNNNSNNGDNGTNNHHHNLSSGKSSRPSKTLLNPGLSNSNGYIINNNSTSGNGNNNNRNTPNLASDYDNQQGLNLCINWKRDRYKEEENHFSNSSSNNNNYHFNGLNNNNNNNLTTSSSGVLMSCVTSPSLSTSGSIINSMDNNDSPNMPVNLKRESSFATVQAAKAAASASVTGKVAEPVGDIEETAPGQFKCRFCDKKFDRIFSVHRHERVHTGYKPCICKVCGRGFSEKRNLRHHIIRFHSDGSGRELLKRVRKEKSLSAASFLKRAAVRLLSNSNYDANGLLEDDMIKDEHVEHTDEGNNGSGNDAVEHVANGELSSLDENDNQTEDNEHHSYSQNHCSHKSSEKDEKMSISNNFSGGSDSQTYDNEKGSSSRRRKGKPSKNIRVMSLDQVGDDSEGIPQNLSNTSNNPPQQYADNNNDTTDTSSTTVINDNNYNNHNGKSSNNNPPSMYNKSPPRLPPNVIIKEEITEDVLSSMKNVRNDYKDSEYNDNNGHDESSDSKMRLHSAFLSNYNSRLIIPEKSLKRAEACRPLMGPDGRYLYPCGYCQKTFCSLSDLNRHIGFHESKDIRPFKCEFCDYQSRTNSQLKVHMMRHAGIKQYLCNICSYNGVTQSDLNRHCKTRSHVLRSSNVCSQCSLGFATSTLLEDHVIKFHGISANNSISESDGARKEKSNSFGFNEKTCKELTSGNREDDADPLQVKKNSNAFTVNNLL